MVNGRMDEDGDGDGEREWCVLINIRKREGSQTRAARECGT